MVARCYRTEASVSRDRSGANPPCDVSWVRRAVVEALGQFRDPRVVAPLIVLLKDILPDIREKAAKHLKTRAPGNPRIQVALAEYKKTEAERKMSEKEVPIHIPGLPGLSGQRSQPAAPPDEF